NPNPNPNTGVFFIDPTIPLNTIEKVQVLNLSGQLIYESGTPEQHQVNIDEMLSGAYIVVIKLDDSLLYAKIVVE
ncbi:MAG: T9SS type A sorting domain-containing protein, partial [Saprospiraceae bacterium]|nr:T9SS type A sorting domain-containing protein [Saprospiraceae bacterium]